MIQPINIGSAPNDGTGQHLRSGGQIINDNFAELDTRTAAAQAKADQGVSNAAAAQATADAAKAKADAAVPGAALGASVAQLVNGTVPAGQLPSYVDDVLEYPTLADFPATGETGKIYIAINGGDSPTNPTRQYRWSGTAFVLIPASPGSTDQVPEGTTNQYFTAARVRSTLLAGLGAAVNAAILASDTVLQAFAKLQGQINAKLGIGDTAADSAKLNGQPASFYTAPMAGATASAAGSKGLVPAPAVLGSNPKYLSDDGTWKEVGATGAALPVGTLYVHMGAADKIPAGMLPLNGQLVDRATWPQLWQKYSSGELLLASEAIWQANPDYRAYGSSGTTASNFRLPDLNGQQSGSIGSVFIRGWNSSMLGPGRMRPDQLGPMKYVNNTYGGTTSVYISNAAGTTATLSRIGVAANPQVTPVDGAADGTRWITNTGDETRPKDVAFIFCIVGATTTSNPGTVDVTALATQVNAQQAQLETIDFTIIYPNGGTDTSPALTAAGARYTNPSPWPGKRLICEAQLQYNGSWISAGWWTTSAQAIGTRAAQNADTVITVVGVGGCMVGYQYAGGSSDYNSGNASANLPVRVRVWRAKG
ncbi:hypothetical protein [Pseudomonas asplenii]|uniref:hypothetical protein n=1 Tax=Pseudomonas asplenii TaxID=53407 RepID=UPI0006B51017|nr:hypothetical protein [Pseudomonas fuscovaginae]KPA98090.1 hypothetical protein PF70_01810 [Pseudomonas fuscovaginae]